MCKETSAKVERQGDNAPYKVHGDIQATMVRELLLLSQRFLPRFEEQQLDDLKSVYMVQHVYQRGIRATDWPSMTEALHLK